MERRTFIQRTALGGAVLLAAGSVPLWLRSKPKGVLVLDGPLRVFSLDEAATLQAAASRLVAPLDASALRVVSKIDALLAAADDATQRDLQQLLAVFGNPLASAVFDARLTPFAEQSAADQDRTLARWRDSHLPFRRSGFQALQRLCLAVTYASPELYAGIGYPGPPQIAHADGSGVEGP